MLRALLLAALLAAQARAAVAPGISLPKRLHWEMSADEARQAMAEQGLALKPDPSPLLPPAWYGEVGWSSALGPWQSAYAVAGTVTRAEYFFAPSNSLQGLTLTAEGPDDVVMAFARRAHSELSNLYTQCGALSLSGHRCRWEDELGFRVSFTFDSKARRVELEYSSRALRKAREATDEL